MTNFTITVQDQSVTNALKALSARLDNLQPVLFTIGQEIVERTKRRFETSTGPDGVPWKPYSAATISMLKDRLEGQKSTSLKRGGLNKRGLAKFNNKKLLIDKGDLRRQIVAVASGKTLTVVASQKYAAIQQYGGKAGRGRKVTIPARPFLPVRPDGSLYPQEQSEVIKSLNDYLSASF